MFNDNRWCVRLVSDLNYQVGTYSNHISLFHSPKSKKSFRNNRQRHLVVTSVLLISRLHCLHYIVRICIVCRRISLKNLWPYGTVIKVPTATGIIFLPHELHNIYAPLTQLFYTYQFLNTEHSSLIIVVFTSPSSALKIEKRKIITRSRQILIEVTFIVFYGNFGYIGSCFEPTHSHYQEHFRQPLVRRE